VKKGIGHDTNPYVFGIGDFRMFKKGTLYESEVRE